MNPLTITALLKASRPLDVIRHGPEEREIRCETDGPSLIVLSELADPELSATLEGKRGPRPAVIRRTFGRSNRGAWQVVGIPEPGPWTLRLYYRGRDVWQGIAVSGVAVVAWLGLGWRFGRVRTRTTEGESK